jgi:crotonobetaine/carnitine-CoA ligase
VILASDLASALEARARATPDAIFLATPGRGTTTFGAFDRSVNRLAHGVRERLGIGAGEPVALMMRNCDDFLVASYGLKKLGAIEVAINTDFRGPGLVHTLNLTKARALIVGADLLEHVIAVADDLPHLREVVVHGEVGANAPEVSARWSVTPLDEAYAERDDAPASAQHRIAAVLFTSGTTGPSKGCMLSHRYALVNARYHAEVLGYTEGDCLYNPFPLYHLDAAYLCVVPAILVGCRAAISSRFSASRFWPEIREVGATVFDFMGATLTIIAKRDPQPDDADNPVRVAWGTPMPEPAKRKAFEDRFGLRLTHNYGLTDGGAPCWESPDGLEPIGSCGRVGPHWDVQIVDEHDAVLPRGEEGEIVIRPLTPGAVMDGYWGMPEQTLETFRGLWLHTGDIGRMDEEDHVFFVSRQTDAIRRRGQNISTWEIEQVINAHPDVLESVALGVPSDLSEEDVKVVVVLRQGSALTAQALIDYCDNRMARYMIPEHVEFVDEIPKTATGKPQRYRLVGDTTGTERPR